MCGSYDAPLSEEGQRQVELLRIRLAAERHFDAVYSSPLKRALDTAAAAWPAPVRVLESLAEIDCGTVDGLPIDDVRRQYPESWRLNESQVDENFAWPGGETYGDFRRRVMLALNSVARQHAGQRVLLFTHAGVVNQVLGAITGQSPAKWESPRPRNTSITRIIWNKDSYSVECFDDCTHLGIPQASSAPETHVRTAENPKPVGGSSVTVEL